LISVIPTVAKNPYAKADRPRKVKIGNTVKPPAHFFAVVHYFLHIGKSHFHSGETAVFRKDVTVFAPLIAVVRYMPLKSKIGFHCWYCSSFI
jgi:hypothetical protein